MVVQHIINAQAKPFLYEQMLWVTREYIPTNPKWNTSNVPNLYTIGNKHHPVTTHETLSV